MDLPTLNGLDRAEFIDVLGGVFEHAPWVAEAAWTARPFASVDALHEAMLGAVRAAPEERQMALLRGHPELAGQEAQEGVLTAESTGEQNRLGFTRLSRDEFDLMQRINAAYREKFDMPCIVALRLHPTRQSVQAEMQRRLALTRDEEIDNNLDQVGHITRGRLDQILAG
ncbi:2-oxo-4-hydroxy-4-carboxy-5-ureidoimidazoline decarboxylase [Roseomonas sp. NAR14]|uniref:2-oxo-4-hydroxy-4-carboxy-5-ureidoimidazoline decarboxylase n=1 Tax=Roseomonas acroporae TaxID=2937791 RepID=A0A9X1Y4Q2_9PROT|nr:2-oxo-4-hydroxy-4-carboxy-5-ureidoimidazoline decarboxylase [Roseomonas acroporae]MCK8784159.1 2-oxo-4-hydroxy-4-carboxy-5-ureidoimidazoline decarboxylase [Roseomonas acroporae]